MAKKSQIGPVQAFESDPSPRHFSASERLAQSVQRCCLKIKTDFVLVLMRKFFRVLETVQHLGALLFFRQYKEYVMPMKLLNQLFNGAMPAQLTEFQDLYNLHILRAAGHVYATIPLPYYAPDNHWHQDPATVHQITPQGYKVLRCFGPARVDQAFEKDRDTVNGFIVPIR